MLAATPNLVEAPRTFLFCFVLMVAAYIAVLSALPRLGQGRTLGVLLTVAVAARLVWLVAAPTLSTDAYRYVWDARVAQAGINPYAYAAAAPEVAHLRDTAIYPRLNHATWRTIYPPGAQAFFRAVYAVAPDSVLAIKIALGAVELLGLGFLVALLRALDLPRNRIVVYAWNPLVLVEVWGSAHVDALVVTGVIAVALALVTRRPAVAAALLGLATLVKLYPVILLPLLARLAGVRVVVVFVLVVALGYAPALGSGLLALGSLPRYLEQEYFNPGLARSVIDSPMVSILAMAAWIAWVVWWRRPSTFVDGALPLTGGFAVLSPNAFPWYVLWVVPFLAVKPSPMWIAFTGTIAFAYAFFLYQPWAIPIWARLLEVAPLVLGTGGTILARVSVHWRKGSSQRDDIPPVAGATIVDDPKDARQGNVTDGVERRGGAHQRLRLGLRPLLPRDRADRSADSRRSAGDL